MQRIFQTSDQLCRYVSEISPEVLLSFSLGKDSIAAWLQLRKYFRKVRPYYLYLIPDLEFVERELLYYEEWFQEPILRLPHPSLFRMLNNLTFQAPQQCRVIEDASLPSPTFDHCSRQAARAFGLSTNTFTANGVRCVDSLLRRASLKKWGSLNPRRRSFMPIFDWTMSQLIESFREASIRLPVDYEMFGRSFDGIDERFLRPIKDRFPDDYARILDWFPLADLELFRDELRKTHA